MNFNDIEFRLRYPKVFLDDERRDKWASGARTPRPATTGSTALSHVSPSWITCLLNAVTRNRFRAPSARQE